MTSKNRDLSDHVDDLLKVVPGGEEDVTKKQVQTKFLPPLSKDALNLDTDQFPVYDPVNDKQGKMVVRNFVDAIGKDIIRDGSVGIKKLNTELRNYLLRDNYYDLRNGDFSYDLNGDGLADDWNIDYTPDVKNPVTTLDPKAMPGYLQNAQTITIDSIGDQPASYINLSQTFPRNFTQNHFFIKGVLWVGGNGEPTVNVTVFWRRSRDGTDNYLMTESYSPDYINKNHDFGLHIQNIPAAASFLTIQFSIIGGVGGPDTTHAFTVGNVRLLLDETDDTYGTFNVKAGGVSYDKVSSLGFVNAKGVKVSPTEVSLTILPYNIEGKEQKYLETRTPNIIMPTSSVSYLDPDKDTSSMIIVPEITISDGIENLESSQFKMDHHFTVKQGTGDDQEFGIIKLKDSILYGTSFLAMASRQEFIRATDRDPMERSAVWFGDPISYMGDGSSYDSKTKSVTLEPDGKGNPKQYLVAVVINVADEIVENGFVRVFFRNRTQAEGDQYLIDDNGGVMAAQYNTKAFESPGQIVLAGIVEVDNPTAISLHIETSYLQGIRLAEPTKAASAFLVQAADCAIDLLPRFESITGCDIGWVLKKFQNPVASLDGMLANDLRLSKYNPFDPGNDVYLAEDGFILIPLLNSMDGSIAGGTLLLEDDPKFNAPFFSFGYYFSEIETVLLRGKTIKAKIDFDPNPYGGKLMVVAWNGVGDPAKGDNVVTGYKDDVHQPVFGQSWRAVETQDFAALSQDAEVSAVVPNDARIFGVVMVPERAVKPMVYMIKKFDISVEPEFTGAVIHYSKSKDEIFFDLKNQYERFIQAPVPGQVIRYTINATEVPCPAGSLETKGLHLPVELDTTVNQVPGSQVKRGEGGIKFKQDMENIKINTSVHIYPGEKLPAGQTANVVFTWYKMDNGNPVGIPGGSHTVTVTKGKPPVFGDFDMLASFKKDDVIFLTMKSDGVDYAFLQSGNAHIPLVENIITQQGLVAQT